MKYFLLSFFCIILFSCNEKQEHFYKDDKSSIVSKLFISKQSKNLSINNDTVYLKDKKFNGVLYSFYENSKDSFSVESFSNGVLDGVSKKYFSNNQLMELRYYTQGQKNGKQVAYWESGKKKFEFTANKDMYEGELKEWNVDGNLIHLGTYINGQEEGTQKMWYDNGKIRANYVILKGKRYGLLGTKNCKNVSDSIFVVK